MHLTRYQLLCRRILRSKPIAFTLFCFALVYLGRAVGFYMSGSGSESHRDKRHELGALRLVFDSILSKDSLESMEAVLKPGIVGNFEPPQEPPRNGPGENGEPVVFATWESEAVQRSIRQYSFNQYISDKISLDRTIPDLRHIQCRSWHYPNQLPQASIIIVFHNEGWSTLLRTVTSVVNKTPPYLLKEIILVDDFSTKEHLHKQLEDYITSSKFKDIVQIVRNRRRQGLIAARMEGTQRASAPVLVFLDSHCELGTNWLPPLLTIVARNSSTIAVPIIDIIDSMTFNVYPQNGGRVARGAFDWNLDYKRIPGLPEKEFRSQQHSTQPYRSPVMSGGVFAIDKAYFLEMGGYDTGLKMWGGENYDLSFKVWMCGGSLLWVPCSRVGHLYRINGIPPYTFPGDTFGNYRDRNYARVAAVWMDGYKEYVYISKPHLQADYVQIGDIKPQLTFRQEKQCKSFNWFMQEVAYDLKEHFPIPPLSVYYGEIQGLSSKVCLDTKGKEPARKGATLGLFKCHGLGGNQFFRLTTLGDIRVNGFCLGQRSINIILTDCHDEHAIKDWVYDEENRRIERKDTHKCLHRTGLEVQMKPCVKGMELQLWTFEDPFRDNTIFGKVR